MFWSGIVPGASFRNPHLRVKLGWASDPETEES